MEEKICVLDIDFDNYTAKQAMKKSVEFMGSEVLKVIELLSIDMLLYTKDREEICDVISGIDMILPGQKEILEAAEICNRKMAQEMDDHLYMKLFLRYLHKNHCRVYLIVESAEKGNELRRCLNEHYRGIQVVGTMVSDGDPSADDMLVNEINGCESDCIIAALQTPCRQRLVHRNKPRINSRIWIGVGDLLESMYKEKKGYLWFLSHMKRIFFKREIKKNKKENLPGAKHTSEH